MKLQAIFAFFFLNLFAQAVLGQTEPNKPIPVAVVSFVDGTEVELLEFSMFSCIKSPLVYYTGTHKIDSKGIPIRQGRFWTVVPVDKIQSVKFMREQSEIQLRDATILKGTIPDRPVYDTWLKGERFEVEGKKTVLGVEGVFAIDWRKIVSISRDDPNTNIYNITDTNGTNTAVTDVSVKQIDPRGSNYRTEYQFPKSEVKFTAANTTVELRLGDIDILTFMARSGDSVKIKMKSGDETTGALEDVCYVFGKIAAGRFLFTETKEVKAVKFK
jgi:hypothetical protein